MTSAMTRGNTFPFQHAPIPRSPSNRSQQTSVTHERREFLRGFGPSVDEVHGGEPTGIGRLLADPQHFGRGVDPGDPVAKLGQREGDGSRAVADIENVERFGWWKHPGQESRPGLTLRAGLIEAAVAVVFCGPVPELSDVRGRVCRVLIGLPGRAFAQGTPFGLDGSPPLAFTGAA